MSRPTGVGSIRSAGIRVVRRVTVTRTTSAQRDRDPAERTGWKAGHSDR